MTCIWCNLCMNGIAENGQQNLNGIRSLEFRLNVLQTQIEPVLDMLGLAKRRLPSSALGNAKGIF